jgi:hypothetical protein
MADSKAYELNGNDLGGYSLYVKRVCCDDSCWADAAAYVGTTASQKGRLGYAETDALKAMTEATKRIDTHLMGSDDGFADHFIMSFQF